MSDAGKTALILGFPAEPACRVASKLASGNEMSVEVVVRPSDLPRAKEQIRRAGTNIEIIEGDWNHIDFGLSGERFRRLSEQVSSIYSLVPPCSYTDGDDLASAKTTGREVLELALAAKNLGQVVVLSHLDVAGNHREAFREVDLAVGQRFDGESAKMRLAAERVYRRRFGEIPITVIRSGWIVGEGEDLCPLVHLCLAAADSSPWEGNGRLLLTDLDYLADVVVGLEDMDPDPGGRTLHIISPFRGDTEEIVNEISSLAREQVPAGFDLAAGARRALSRMDKTCRWSTGAFFKRRMSAAQFETTWTEDFLRSRGLPLPVEERSKLDLMVTIALEEIVGFR